MRLKKIVAWLLCVSMMLPVTQINTFAQEDSYVEAVENRDESPSSSESIGDDGSDESGQTDEETGNPYETDESMSAETNEDVGNASSAETEIENGTAEDKTAETDEAADREITIEKKETSETIEAEAVLMSTVVASGTCGAQGGNLTWTLDSEGTLAIKGSGMMAYYYGYSSIPWHNYRSSIKTASIGEGVTSIGNDAFYNCSSLTSVTIPEGVTSIGWDAFQYCSSLTSVTIPSSVTSIGYYAFQYCSSLTSVVIPEGVTSIGGSAFGGCSSLKSVYITDLAAWCKIKFDGYDANPLCNGADLYIGEEKATDIVIPEGVTSIGRYAFSGCSSLTSVNIPEGVTSIGDDAFEYCRSLTSVTIPEGVTSIGDSAFRYCSSLTSVTIPSSVTSIGYGAFRDCSSLTSVTIPEGVTSIGDSAFRYCSILTSVTIPSSVTSIGGGAFSGCSSLTSVTIPEGVTSIGKEALSRCSSLTSVTIPSSVTSIGDDTFYGCSSLTSVVIPEGVTSIGRYAFSGCSSLTIYGYAGSYAETYAKNNSIPFVALDGKAKYTITYNPNGGSGGPETQTKYQGIDVFLSTDKPVHEGYTFLGWSTSASGDVEYLSGDKYSDDKNVTLYAKWEKHTDIPIDIEKYGKCGENLVWILYSDGTLEISGTGNMTSFANAESVPWSDYTGDIKSVVVKDGVASIGAYAFSDCVNLESVKLPDTLEKIEQYAFGRCSSLKEIDIPECVKTIGYYCFNYCTGLERVTFGGVIESIGSNAFINCSSLKEIIFADGTESIANGIFYNCSALEKVVIPESVTSIGETTFDGCDSLTIYGYSGSYAETYADNHSIPFAALDEHVCTYSGDWIIEKEATVFAEGLKYRICDVCGKRCEEVIPKLVIDITQNENYGLAHFTVVDATAPENTISGVKVVIKTPNDGEGVFITDSNGKFSATLPVGKLTATVSKDGYITRSLKLSITPGEKEMPTIGISTEELVEAEFDYEEMDLDDIINAGIDITAPGNQHVYKYKMDFEFVPDYYDLEFFFNEKGEFIGHGYDPISPNDPDDPDTPEYPDYPYDPDIPDIPGKDYYPPYIPAPKDPNAPIPPIKVPDATGEITTSIYPVNERFYLIVHGEAKWLKEMYDIEMLIINNSLTDTVEDCTATISLPDGLSLADMISEIGAQSLAQTVDYIEEGGTKSVHWYVRGDKEGEYNVTGTLDGMLMPFEEEFHYEYELDSPIKVYAGSALHMTIYAPEAAYYGEDYTVRIEFENVSHKPIYGFTNSILGVKQCKVTRYSNGEIAEETYVEENKTQKTVLDTFNPGDKVVIEISSNILFRSEIILNKLKKLSAQIDGLELIIESYRAVEKNSEEINKADGYLKDFIELIEAEANLEDNQVRKTSLDNLKLALDTVYAKFLKNDVKALNVVNGFKRYGCYDDLIIYALGIESLDLLTAEKADMLTEIMISISENNEDTELLFAALRDALQTIPMRFILEDVTVVTLEGSTTEIPYSVKVIPDTSDSYSDFVNISNNIRKLVEKAAGSLDIPWFIGAINASNVIPRESISFDEKAYFAAKSATGQTKYKAWIERADEVALMSLEEDFALSSDTEDASVENGVLTFTGSGYVEITSLSGNNGVLHVEITEGSDTRTISYNLNVVGEHVCHSDGWTVIVDEDYMSDGYRVKMCSECGDFMDVEAFRTKHTGDINGDNEITDTDAIYLMYYTFFPEEYQTNQLCDFDGDGKVTDNDAIYLMYHTFFPEEYPLSN